MLSHRATSAIVIAVNLEALVAEARRADVIIELAPRVGDFVTRDDPLFLLYGNGTTKIDEHRLYGQVAFGPERTSRHEDPDCRPCAASAEAGRWQGPRRSDRLRFA